MTREEILKLKGRKLDAKVAFIIFEDSVAGIDGQYYTSGRGIPLYSLYMNEAMLVVEKMRERGYGGFCLAQWKDDTWSADYDFMVFEDDAHHGFSKGHKSPAEAICKAALLALEGE